MALRSSQFQYVSRRCHADSDEAPGVGMWSVLYAYTPEPFPTRARATGCGTASSWGRVGALIGPSVVPMIMASYGVPMVFTVGALAFVVGAAAVLILGPETKGKVLEEISA